MLCALTFRGPGFWFLAGPDRTPATPASHADQKPRDLFWRVAAHFFCRAARIWPEGRPFGGQGRFHHLPDTGSYFFPFRFIYLCRNSWLKMHEPGALIHPFTRSSALW